MRQWFQNGVSLPFRLVIVQHQGNRGCALNSQRLLVVFVDVRPCQSRRSERTSLSAQSEDWIRWMLVDSPSGSMNLLARPTATTFLFQNFLRRPVTKAQVRGSANFSPSRLCSRGWPVLAHELAGKYAVADVVLQRDAPLPTCRPRRRARVRRGSFRIGAGHGNGAVTGSQCVSLHS